jgi:hypothetical protein
VTFMVNAIEHLGHIGEAVTNKSLTPGMAISTRLPPTARDIQMRVPSGILESISPPDPQELTWGPARLGGVYMLSWSEPGSPERQTRAFAVNLRSDREGHIAATTELTLGVERVSGQRVAAGRYRPLWPWALALCLGLLMVEWWVYHRKMYS